MNENDKPVQNTSPLIPETHKRTDSQKLIEQKLERRVSQTLSVAYLNARALAESMGMLVRDIKYLPPNEQAAVRLAHSGAYQALLQLTGLVDDVGNSPQPLVRSDLQSVANGGSPT